MDDLQGWAWQLVATVTIRTARRPYTLEAWVALRPDGWYILADTFTAPRGPYPDYATACTQAAASIGAPQTTASRPPPE